MPGKVWPGCAGGTVPGSVDLIGSFQKLNLSTVCSILAVPFFPNTQWVSQRGALSWITEQLDIRAGIRHWDSEGPLMSPEMGLNQDLEVLPLGIHPKEIKPRHKYAHCSDI